MLLLATAFLQLLGSLQGACVDFTGESELENAVMVHEPLVEPDFLLFGVPSVGPLPEASLPGKNPTAGHGSPQLVRRTPREVQGLPSTPLLSFQGTLRGVQRFPCAAK